MRRYNLEFGKAVVAMLDSLGLSHRKASEATGGRISQAYWNHLKSGSVPSYEVMKVIHETFGESAREVVAASGYTFAEPVSSLENIDATAALPVPAGAMIPGKDTRHFPKGPPGSAQDACGMGDPGYDTIVLGDIAVQHGADYFLKVKGDCLAPHICDGDLVGIKQSSTARNGQVVIAQTIDDVLHGELGDGWTLKIWRTNGSGGEGYYRADGTMAYSSVQAKKRGTVVTVVRTKVPSFK